MRELEYCMKELGFRGIEIGTNVRGVELSDERFEPLFGPRRRSSVRSSSCIRAASPTRAGSTRHFLTNVIGNPLDTTFALSHLVFGGVLERYPRSEDSSRRTAAATSATTRRAWIMRTACAPSATTTSSARRPTT